MRGSDDWLRDLSMVLGYLAGGLRRDREVLPDSEVCPASGVDWSAVIGWLMVSICGCGGAVRED
jgi:hypothetical protein